MPEHSSAPGQKPVILSKAKGRVEGPAADGCPILDSLIVKDGFFSFLRPKSLLQSTLLFCTLLLTLGANDPAHRFEKLGHEMICTCGCGQILLECNHVGCPVSAPMITELHDQLSGGGTNISILNWFAAKYGATVMAAPMRGGFDNVAWITPFAVFFLATIGTAVVIRTWKLRFAKPVPAAPGWVSPETTALRDRIRRETEY